MNFLEKLHLPAIGSPIQRPALQFQPYRTLRRESCAGIGCLQRALAQHRGLREFIARRADGHDGSVLSMKEILVLQAKLEFRLAWKQDWTLTSRIGFHLQAPCLRFLRGLRSYGEWRFPLPARPRTESAQPKAWRCRLKARLSAQVSHFQHAPTSPQRRPNARPG